MRMGSEGVNRGKLGEEGGVYFVLSREICDYDSGASGDDCCPSEDRDCVSNARTAQCCDAVHDRPNARHEHHDS